MIVRTLVIVGSVLGLAARALAVCNVNTCTETALVTNPVCCSATACTLDGTINLTGSDCTLNFGARAVTLAGTIVANGKNVTIRAGSFQTTTTGCQAGKCGYLDASGASPRAGGNVLIITSAGINIQGNGGSGINVSGFGEGGGTVTLQAGGSIVLGAGDILASGSEANASGGQIEIDAGKDLTVANAVRADAQVGGAGGEIDLSSVGNTNVLDTGRITVLGGALDAGNIEVDAGGTILVTTNGQLQADAVGTSAGFGGSIELTGAKLDIRGLVEANGGTDTTGDAGGIGGTIALEATHGTLSVTGTGIAAQGAGGGDGGEIDVSTDSPTFGNVSLAAPISVLGKGGILNRPGGGGLLEVTSSRGFALTKQVIATGQGSATGTVDLEANGDVLIAASIQANDIAGGGLLNVQSGHNINFNPGFAARVNGLVDSRFPVSPGGSVTVSAGNNLTINGYTIDASGAASGPGGGIFMDAGQNLGLTSVAGTLLDASSGGNAGTRAGTVHLTAGSPDQPGILDIAGDVDATGRSTNTPTPGSIILSGCTVNVSGNIDSRGDTGSFNVVTGRASITIPGNIHATKSNTAVMIAGSPTVSGNVKPAFTVQRHAACTSRHCSVTTATGCKDTADCPSGETCAARPANCLMPCPTCNNGKVEFPEDCDPPGCPTCDAHCRSLPASCSDNNPCTIDTCDVNLGCLNEPATDGTPCDDRNVCTLNDSCLGGDCVPGELRNCSDNNLCTIDTCNETTGCVHTSDPNGCKCAKDADCSDHDACNGTETCNLATKTCVPGTPLDCDDNNPCTTDTCDSTQAVPCQNVPIRGCQQCTTDLDCANPADICRPCVSGVCETTPNCCSSDAQCDDLEPCTADSCNTAQHQCTHTAAADGSVTPGCKTLCGSCQGGQCQIPQCPDDGDPNNCTVGVCDPVAGQCSFGPDPQCCTTDANCNDNDACTVDSCNALTRHCDHTASKPECVDCTGDLDCDPDGRCAGRTCGADGTCTSFAAPNCDDRRPNFAGRCVLDAGLQPSCQYH